MEYVALLRGNGPTNPNIRNEKLRGVLEELGFDNAATVISSGNVIFEADSGTDPAELEKRIEAAWPERLGFNSTTIVRTRSQLQRLIEVLAVTDRAVCTVIDTTTASTSDAMRWLERTFGKDITTRTWKTVHRIVKKMAA